MTASGLAPSREGTVQALAAALGGNAGPLEGLDAADVERLADEHGVSALVWQAAAHAGGTAARVRTALDPRVRADATRDLLVQAEMRRVLSAIAADGGRALVFKGSALAYTVYAQPWLRPRTDTDLLTSVDDFRRVSTAIEACGYARSDALSTGAFVSHQVAFERVDVHGLRHVVDLHWKVVNPQVLADVVPFEEAWATARPAPALGPAARVPSPVTSVVLACVHRLAHHQGHDRLIWLHDLELLASAFDADDWRTVVELATACGVAAIVLDGLDRAHQTLGSPLPAEVRAKLDAAGRSEPTRVYVDTTIRKRDVLRSDLATLRGWRPRLRLLIEHAFPPPAFVLQRYGVRSRLWLPLLYLHRLVTGAFRWARP